MKKNTKTKNEFINSQIYWGFVSTCWYLTFFFHNLKGLSTFLSICWLVVILTSVCTLFSLQQMKSQRNYFSIFQNLICGYGLYTVGLYLPYQNSLVPISLTVGLLVGIGLFFLIFKKGKLWLTLKVSFRYALSLSLSIILLITFMNISLGHRAALPYLIPFPASAQLDDALITKLTPSVWKTLSLNEKLRTLQQVANIECENLGLSKKPAVGIHREEEFRGYYSNRKEEVRIQADLLWADSTLRLIKTVAHEVYHCYEYELCETYNRWDEEKKSLWKERVEQYQYEFDHYVSSPESFEEYYYQSVEVDARNYSDERVEVWKNFFPEDEEYY